MLSIMRIKEFQFQTGSIRSFAQHALDASLSCFNSKLVRLEGKGIASYDVAVTEFQFQTGSIRRPIKQLQYAVILEHVSIPNWFD